MRLRVSTLLRIAFALGLTLFVLWRAHPDKVWASLRQASWSPLAAACLLVIVDRTLMAYRWMALLGPVGSVRPPFATLARIFFVSTFVGSFLPASVGSDAARVWSLQRAGVARAPSLASVLMDRLLGVVSVLLAAILGLAVAPDALNDRVVAWSMGMIGAGSALALAVVFSTRLDDAMRAWLARRPTGRLQGAASRVLDALQAYRSEHRVLVVVLVASMAVQVLRILQAWLLGMSLGLPLSVATYFALIPMMLLVMMLPISIGGLGVGNQAFEWAFGRVGVVSASAFALSMLFIALGVAGNLPGGLLYVFGPKRTVAQSPD